MLRNIGRRLQEFAKKNPARIYAFSSALAVYISKKIPELPPETIVIFIAAIFGLGESVQRIENKKTNEALCKEPPKGES